MSAALLYDMFKQKTRYPLHFAIRMKREDVVFLYLIEYSQQVCDISTYIQEQLEYTLFLLFGNKNILYTTSKIQDIQICNIISIINYAQKLQSANINISFLSDIYNWNYLRRIYSSYVCIFGFLFL